MLGALTPILVSSCVLEEPAVNQTAPSFTVAGTSAAVGYDRTKYQTNDYFDAEKKEIHLTGAVNETVAFQFVLHGSDRAAKGLRIGFRTLRFGDDSIPLDAVRIYRRWPVAIDRYPNWYLRSVGPSERRQVYDVLVPIDAPRHGQPFAVRPGSDLTLWVEIRIPFLAQVGAYRGALVIEDPDGNRETTPVALNVRDVFLSADDAVPIVARVQMAPIIAAHTDIDPENKRLIFEDAHAQEVLRRTFVLLQEHGLSPFTDEIHPRFEQDIDGSVNLDWETYDAFCEPLIDGSAYDDGRVPWAWPLPVDLTQPEPSQYGGFQSTEYTVVLRNYLAAAAGHFEEKGWIDLAFVHFELPAGPNPTQEDLQTIRQLANLVHLAGGGAGFITRLIPQPMDAFGWFDHCHEDLSALIDVWATSARYEHGPTLERLQALGKRTWLVPDRPPFSGSLAVEAPPVQARSIPWQAYLQGHEAILLDRTTDWPDDLLERPIRQSAQPTGNWLVYPGKAFGLDGPVPSVRLKQLQLGIQDFQRLRLLEQNGHGGTARLLARSLIKASGTDAYGDNYQDALFGRRVNEPKLWEQAAAILRDDVHNALHASPELGGERISDRARWAGFLGATRNIDMWIEGARLRLDDRPNQTGLLMSYEIAIRSELPTPLEGRLEFGLLPTGAKSVSDIERVGPVAEMGLARKQLVASFPALPATDLNGHLAQPIVFDAGTMGHEEIDATVSIVQAPPALFPIEVDGNLEDWPPNDFNAAGDFRRITAYKGANDERAPAQSQTIAYFARDRESLYIGIHAAMPPIDETRTTKPARLRNSLEYEDMMPVGEDLVEILIDPTNQGTLSDDLYHIVVKSTGNPVFERGVGTTPPIGEVRPWPGMVPRCAVVRTPHGWSAEIEIPLTAFGPRASANPIWGLNLTRLEPIRGEYSDWARAPRHCYDPRTLGNLVWPN